MSEALEWGLIGHRNSGSYPNVGGELARQIAEPGVAQRYGLSPKPLFIVKTSGIYEADGETPSAVSSLTDVNDFPDVTFVALPSTDDGLVAYDNIAHILDRGKRVVTAEKGAIANNFADLEARSENFQRLGITATVGGGTRMIKIAQEYCQVHPDITQIHVTPNGTTTAMLSLIGPQGGAAGVSLGIAADQVVRLGYAEPPGPGSSQTPQEIIKGEAEGDIPKKTAIFFNAVGLGDTVLDWKKLQFELKPEDIVRVIKEATERRFIVSYYSKQFFQEFVSRSDDDTVGGFSVEHDGWQIVGGFQHVGQNPLFGELATLNGPGNGVVFGLGHNERYGHPVLKGSGAGPGPTAYTMLSDYLAMRRDSA